jgi:uncharacterized membrane protein
MVNSKELAIGYVLIFLGIYILSISLGTVYYKINPEAEAPQYINATMDAVSGMSYNSFALSSVAIIVLATAIVVGGCIRTFGAF